jgi:hypothetical protein
MSVSALQAPKLLLLAASLLVVVGIALFLLLRSSSSQPKVLVRVFFCAPSDLKATCPEGRPTRAQIDAVTAVAGKLVADGRAESARFVSSRAALARMRTSNPQLVKGLHANPFPDAEELVVRGNDQAADVAAQFHRGRNGVSNVIYARRIVGIAT